MAGSAQPFTEIVTIYFDKPVSNAKIIMTDILGNMVYELMVINDNKVQLNTVSLNKGVYFIFLQSEGSKTVKKVVKI